MDLFKVELQAGISDIFKDCLSQAVSIDAHKASIYPVYYLHAPHRIIVGLAENHVACAHNSPASRLSKTTPQKTDTKARGHSHIISSDGR
jgi:hypothetical protein